MPLRLKRSSPGTVVDALDQAGRRLTLVAILALAGATTSGLLLPPATIAAVPTLPRGGFHQLAATQAPRRLVVSSLGIDAPIVPIQESLGGVITPPSDAQEVGWWNASAKPGSATGQTVITGHTVHYGGGQMDHLGSIPQGALIQVVTSGGTVWYRETNVVVYTKAQVVEDASQLFNQQLAHNRLELITCTGWTGSYYTSNVFVFAQPLGVPNPSRGTTQ